MSLYGDGLAALRSTARTGERARGLVSGYQASRAVLGAEWSTVAGMVGVESERPTMRAVRDDMDTTNGEIFSAWGDWVVARTNLRVSEARLAAFNTWSARWGDWFRANVSRFDAPDALERLGRWTDSAWANAQVQDANAQLEQFKAQSRGFREELVAAGVTPTAPEREAEIPRAPESPSGFSTIAIGALIVAGIAAVAYLVRGSPR